MMAVDSGSYDEATLARQRMAAALLGGALKPEENVKHWAQGLANLAKAGIGGYMGYQANEEAKQQREQANADIYKTLGLAPPAPAAAAESPSVFSKIGSMLSGGGAPAADMPAGAPGDQAVYAPPPAPPPAPTTFRPGIAAPAPPAASAVPAAAPDYSKAIAGIESGGAYDKLGPVTKTGDRAYGKYQVMGNNIPEWTTQVFGKPMTPEQFLSNPDAQEAVFKSKFGDYVQKYGPEGAAKAWFAGEKGMNNPAAKDALGTTVAAYADKFNRALPPSVTGAPTDISAAARTPPDAAPSGGILAGIPQDRRLQIAQMLTSRNPAMRTMGSAMMQSVISGEGVTTVDAGNKVIVMDKRGNVVKELAKGEPNKGPTFGDTGEIDPQTGQPVKGWIDPRDKSVSPYRPTATAAQPSTIPPVPVGVDPKVWREKYSQRSAEDALPADTKTVSALRNEIQGLPSYKNVAQAAPVYKSMLEAAGRDTRAADVNMIYGMAKIMDPGSVVRESEMSVAQAIATLPQQLQAAVKSQLTESGRLTPELRTAIMQEARSRIGAYQAMFDQDATMYRGIAQRGRMNEADVLPTFGPFEEFKPPTIKPPAAGVSPQQIDDLVKKYLP